MGIDIFKLELIKTQESKKYKKGNNYPSLTHSMLPLVYFLYICEQ